MARTSSDTGKTPFLPQGANAFLRRRAVAAGGLAVLVAGMALLAAIFSYSSDDPSLNKAIDGPVSNLMGPWGAVIADLGLQTIGTVALLPGLVLVSWGSRVMAGKAMGRLWLRIALLPLALSLVATGAAGIPPPESWGQRSGLGGYLGDMALRETIAFIGGIGLRADVLLVSLPILLAGFGVLAYVLGFSLSEWRSGGRFAWRGAKAGGRLAGRGASAGLNAGRGITATVQRGMATRKARIEPQMPDLRGRRPLAAADLAPEANEVRGAPSPRMGAEANGLVAPRIGRTRPGRRATAARQTTLNLVLEGDYELPSLDLLDHRGEDNSGLRIRDQKFVSESGQDASAQRSQSQTAQMVWNPLSHHLRGQRMSRHRELRLLRAPPNHELAVAKDSPGRVPARTSIQPANRLGRIQAAQERYDSPVGNSADQSGIVSVSVTPRRNGYEVVRSVKAKTG
ncbi:MAG: DNA translocase FtsK 4TM domain-containing protein, partial [Alphaproteobacteria bacterium]